MVSQMFPSEDDSACPGGADAVARGVTRLFARHQIAVQREVSLRNARRADLMGVSDKGDIVIVEIKCSRADLLGDRKWPDYLDFCDKYYWAIPPSLDPALASGEGFLPDRTGLIIADAYDAEIARPAQRHALAAARRKVEMQRLAFVAMQRLAKQADPELMRLLALGAD